MSVEVRHGEALEVLRTLPEHSVHALVTDPPAGIGFMGKDWDGDKGGRGPWIYWLAQILRECRRVMKPGAHALVWALPRTSHWTGTAIEDAGFEVRDVVHHLFGTGYPKSLDVSKAIDKAAGAEREVLGVRSSYRPHSGAVADPSGFQDRSDGRVTAPATEAARQWSGWGTALKPSAEHWILARVPLVGSVAQNVVEHGCGALHIDACRIGDTVETWPASRSPMMRRIAGQEKGETEATGAVPPGRWPAHVVLSGDAVEELDRQSGELQTHGGTVRPDHAALGYHGRGSGSSRPVIASRGGASRFFYCAKPSRAERGVGNAHPTVKSIELMRWLIRLITPPGGTVLDPFAGSGSTGIACIAEGRFNALLIEQESNYAELAIERARRESPLFWNDPA